MAYDPGYFCTVESCAKSRHNWDADENEGMPLKNNRNSLKMHIIGMDAEPNHAEAKEREEWYDADPSYWQAEPPEQEQEQNDENDDEGEEEMPTRAEYERQHDPEADNEEQEDDDRSVPVGVTDDVANGGGNGGGGDHGGDSGGGGGFPIALLIGLGIAAGLLWWYLQQRKKRKSQRQGAHVERRNDIEVTEDTRERSSPTTDGGTEQGEEDDLFLGGDGAV